MPSLHSLPKIVGSKKRVGRGIGSRGAKSGRGMKGQRSRAGYSHRAGFEGGQTPLYQRVPKGRGAKQISEPQTRKPVAVRVAQLNAFEKDSVVGPGAMRSAGLVESRRDLVKLVNGGTLAHKLTVRVHAATKGAQSGVEAVGGKVELIAPESRTSGK